MVGSRLKNITGGESWKILTVAHDPKTSYGDDGIKTLHREVYRIALSIVICAQESCILHEHGF
jgi:hypothetical protein